MNVYFGVLKSMKLVSYIYIVISNLLIVVPNYTITVDMTFDTVVPNYTIRAENQERE